MTDNDDFTMYCVWEVLLTEFCYLLINRVFKQRTTKSDVNDSPGRPEPTRGSEQTLRRPTTEYILSEMVIQPLLTPGDETKNGRSSGRVHMEEYRYHTSTVSSLRVRTHRKSSEMNTV